MSHVYHMKTTLVDTTRYLSFSSRHHAILYINIHTKRIKVSISTVYGEVLVTCVYYAYELTCMSPESKAWCMRSRVRPSRKHLYHR